MNQNLNNVKENIITVDVFDTLVIRNVVSPIDVFDMVGGKHFRYARIIAELVARKLSKNEEVTLDEIYHFLPIKFKEKEIAIEKDVCKPNPKIYEIYKDLKAQGKKIYAISDMYLPKDVISDILKNCGYELDGIYISSEVGLSKATGNLYKYFLNENNYDPKNVLHIGDNKTSDYNGANLVGINAILINKTENKLTYLNKNNDYYLRGFVNHQLNQMDNRLDQIGFEVLGPILVSFCQWIHSKRSEFNFEKLFFMSRDMHIVYDAYNMMYPEDDIAYIQISRKSLQNARKSSVGLCEYLKKMGCLGNVAIVDTGWRCVAQPIIEYYAKSIQNTSSIGGLYLGATTGYNYVPRHESSATCFYKSKIDYIKSQTYTSSIESLLGYNEDKVVDYNQNGEPVLKTETKRITEIQQIQESALLFVNSWIENTNNRVIESRNAFSPYKHMQNDPLSKDIDLLESSEFDDKCTSYLVHYKNSIFHNPKIWLKNMSLSVWKGAYFKRSFKIYKPFYWSYLFLNSLYLSFVDIKQYRNKDLFYLMSYYK